MKYGRKNEMKDDGLKISKFVSSTIYLFRPVKIYLGFQLILQCSLTIFQIHFFIHRASLEELLQYTPFFFGLFYGILAVFVLLKQPYVIENISEEVYLWSIDSSTNERAREIRNEMRFVETFIIINTVFALIVSSCMYLNVELQHEFCLPIKLIIDYCQSYSTFLVELYKIVTFPLIFTVYMAQCYQMIYYTQHIKYQVLMLLDHFNAITACSEEFRVQNQHPIDNLLYQKEIKRRLRFLIRRHQELLMSGLRKIRGISHLIVYFSLCGVLVGFCVVILVVSGFKNSQGYIQICMSGVLVTTTTLALIMAGQSIQSVTDDVYHIQRDVKWYEMNCENRRTYLNMLIGAKKSISINFSDKYTINYDLGFAIIKLVYSAISVFINIQTN